MARRLPANPSKTPARAIGSSPRSALSLPLSAIFGLVFSTAIVSNAWGGDLLRGGAATGAPGSNRRGPETQVDSQAAKLSGNANDALARTTQALESVRTMQATAREIAARRASAGINFQDKPLPAVPNGLRPGGLEIDPEVSAGNTALWKGARLPVQSNSGTSTRVVIAQEEQTAILNWKTFNVGKNTTVFFNQSKGGDRKSEWIAFNKINDPSGVPSQILGSIKAEGQVYLINRNGIIFGGASTVDVHTLVASALPINDNLIKQGLLNNRDAQFLFSALPVPGGADGTPAFNPTISDPEFNPTAAANTYKLLEKVALNSTNAALKTEFAFKTATGVYTKLVAGTDYTVAIDAPNKTATATFTAAGLAKINGAPVRATYTPVVVKSGEVLVQAGASLISPVTADGNGGRLMFVGTNVTNAGTLSTTAGQTILAAGLQVGMAAHASDDPSLRGLDVFVGAVDATSGTATNRGLIEAYLGSATMAGRYVNQLAAIESSTSVNLNGRIDLQASYGAVSNPNFDNANAGSRGGGLPIFVFQHTGVVEVGENSVTRILPDYLSEDTVPGIALPEVSQINALGQAVHFGRNALVLAPNGNVSVRAGRWNYVDANGDRTIFGNVADSVDPDIAFIGNAGAQQLFFTQGQVYLDPSAMINVAGSTDVFVPLAQSILEVQFRGAELSDSPLQRGGPLRGAPLTIDVRRTGEFDGRYWIGTPLADATGLVGLIQRNAAQLTANGGNVTMRAGESIVIRSGATVDVSGGYFRNEAGMVKTTRLLQNGLLVDIANAVPNQIYDGVYTGEFTRTFGRWGVTETFTVPWMTGEHFEASYIDGAAAGTLAMTAPSMAIDGELRGATLQGPRQRSSPAGLGSLSLSFKSERFEPLTNTYLTVSPTPPSITFQANVAQPSPAPFGVDQADIPAPLPGVRSQVVFLSPELVGPENFGNLTIENTDGNVTVPAGVEVTTQARGSLTITATNVNVAGSVTAPSGSLTFRVLNLSPEAVALFNATPNVATVPPPNPNPNRGLFGLETGGSLSVAGLLVNDLPNSETPLAPLAINGGKIRIETYAADLAEGGSIDVSGGASISGRGAIRYGNGGELVINTGRDLNLPRVIDGTLILKSELSGYSGATGGSLSLQANAVQIGSGSPEFPSTLLLTPEFFRNGGFASYSLTGIGPVTIGPGTVIAPVAENWLAAVVPDASLHSVLNPVGFRSPVNLSFTSLGYNRDSNDGLLDIGNVVMSAGAQIITDPGATVSFKGETVTILGSVSTPGGQIIIAGANKYPLEVASGDPIPPFAQATVYIGPNARLSTAGTVVMKPDPFGRRFGTLYPGGTISISGNIIAEAGAVLDVSGTFGIFDQSPASLGMAGSPIVPVNSGLTAPLWSLATVATRVDSAGGLIDLTGSEMLLTDATLLGFSGGPTASGGTLSVASNRFSDMVAPVSGADINLVVTAGGNTIARGNKNLGVGSGAFDSSGARVGKGYFAANRFTNGGFDSLDLGYKYFGTIGGNVRFDGPVSINARGSIRIAGGGIVEANDSVNLTASYLAIGQSFRVPANPEDLDPILFPDMTGTQPLSLPPVSGPGNLSIKATTIDVGTVSFQGIGRATLAADGGDIRGNGTLNIAGDLTLRAAQVYPTTLSEFNIFAYDRSVIVGSSTANSTQVMLASAALPYGFRVGVPLLGSTVVAISGNTVTLASGANATITAPTQIPFTPGSVTITRSGSADAPLSAGGSLNIFASNIVQGGVLRAPMGSITLGWDGTDFDLSDPALDSPFDPIARGILPFPISRVTLKSGSLTSVSASGLLIPFGLSPDGSTWIDPSGVNVTATGLPEKKVAIAGDSVAQQRGSTVDLQGGGDLYAYRWVPGPGGSIDLLGTAASSWVEGVEYQAGDLVNFGGRTWSARVRHSGQSPTISPYWSQVPESYAVLPGYSAPVAPYAPFNTGVNATALEGDPGYVPRSLKIGDRIYLGETPGLNAGTYTLLPSRYALLPGAFLITPTGRNFVTDVTLLDGSSYTSGITFNQFRRGAELSPLRTQYEVAPFDVVRTRAEYADYFANSFMREAAINLDIDLPQRLPIDSGRLALHGNSALQLSGNVLTDHPFTGRGSSIDISSFADMYVIGKGGSAPTGAKVVLKTSVLESWGASSLLIGGLRREGGNGTTIEVRSNHVTLDNPGEIFTAPEITFVSKQTLTLTDGSKVAAAGDLTEPAKTFLITGDGVLLRASRDQYATTIRTGTTAATTALITLGAGSAVAGRAVILDSSYGTSLDPDASLAATALTLGSGQISIVFGDPATPLTGSEVTPHLTIAGDLLDDVSHVRLLTLRSYRTIDFYNTGTFGSASLGSLTFQAGGIRGFNQGAGAAIVEAKQVTFSNPSSGTLLAPPPGALAGTFQVDTGKLTFGVNAFSVLGYADVLLNATSGAIGKGAGSFTVAGNLTINTPVFAGAQRANQTITAVGDLVLANPFAATDGSGGGGLGASLIFNGDSVTANTRIVALSGGITLRATGTNADDDLILGGTLDVSAGSRTFFDQTYYADAGSVLLSSNAGDVHLLAGSSVSVAGQAGGGNAGTVIVSAGKGEFVSDPAAEFIGTAAAGKTTGSFVLDAGTLASFDDLNLVLNKGGFFEKRNLRVRAGDITIANIGGEPLKARDFTVSTDTGDINVVGTIDVSGETGGKIVLIAGDDLVLDSGAMLDARGEKFSSAGKGGEIHLEAGAMVSASGAPNADGSLEIRVGSTIELGVAAYQTDADSNPLNDYLTQDTSAFHGQFQGTLHLRAPRSGLAPNGDGFGTGINITPIGGTINGASSILAEGYKVYTLTNATGEITTATQNLIRTEGQAYMGMAGVAGGAYTGMFNALTPLLSPEAQAVFVLAPGAEIRRASGDILLGVAGAAATSDWSLSNSSASLDFRFGPKSAAGVLTIRAPGDLVFNNTLSDGFTPTAANATTGNSTQWLAQLRAFNSALPFNTQSWSFRLTAGADLTAADSRSVLSTGQLNGKGSLLLGEFYAPVPNTNSNAVGSTGQTANTIAIGSNGTRFEVIRTGTGAIEINAGRDVQLRNQFASIYTAGARLPSPTSIYTDSDFVSPVVAFNADQTTALGVAQQNYAPQWSMAGGEVAISAQGDIRRVTLLNGVLIDDATRQLPNSWLYRRGYVDPATGLFGSIRLSQGLNSFTDAALSTTWWIDFSNFFQGVGALGGGDVSLVAGGNVVNVDGVTPTNARMPGRIRNSDGTFSNVAPDPTKLLELGGGDLVVRAGNNIDGGIYYVERGTGQLFAGGAITTNAARSPSLGILFDSDTTIPGTQPTEANSLTWLPTTLFVGKSTFDVAARGDILLGPVSNPFLLPQSNNNRFWYKTHFNTFSEDAGASVVSFGGSVTHRLAATPGSSPEPILLTWLRTQHQFSSGDTGNRSSKASYFQPWLRLAETEVSSFSTLLSINAPNLSSAAFNGDVNMVGSLSLFPSPTGNLAISASGNIVGLNASGETSSGNGRILIAYSSSTINISDADPTLFPGVGSPLAFQQVFPGATNLVLQRTSSDVLQPLDLFFNETGSYTGDAASVKVQRALHATSLLHKDDLVPIRLYAAGGDITGLTLFAPKKAEILAAQDIVDDSFYIQHVNADDISFVSAGRDIIPNNENAPIRTNANNVDAGNLVVGFQPTALAGDIQINGPGVLEVLAGRNIDLGKSANNTDGTGVGITSVGNARNPALPVTGADLVILAGISSPEGDGPALGLTGSSADFQSFIDDYLAEGSDIESAYLTKLGPKVEFEDLTSEQQAVVALEVFYRVLRDAGRAETEEGATGGYDDGFAAIDSLFGSGKFSGEILTRSRDIRTRTGGAISMAAPGGSITMASDITGNPQLPPGIVTEFGGAISAFVDDSVNIGKARIFTLRGGDITIWASNGDIAAGNAPKTVVSAPPTRVVIDVNSANVQTDLGGLATGGGIGVLAAVKNVPPGNVDLIAPNGAVDAGDAGIRATGNLNIAATVVLNADNIQVGGSSSGVPAVAPPAAPSLSAPPPPPPPPPPAGPSEAEKEKAKEKAAEDAPSIIEVELLTYDA